MDRTLGRHTWLLVCAALLAVPQLTTAEDDATAVANEIIGSLTKASAARNGKAWAAEFWPDAEFVNVFGGVMEGQQEIESRMEFLFKGPLKNRRTLMTPRKVRMLAPNVIVVDTIDTDSAGATRAETRLKLIIQRRDSVWRIVAAQNTRVSTPSF
jgi:uncharacterized protein (TIGR02246 family)